MLRGYYNLSKTTLFLLVVILGTLFSWLSRTVLVNDIVFYNTYSEQLSYERSMTLFETMKKVVWLSYLIVPVVLIIKFTLISVMLYAGIILYNINHSIKFSSVFKIVIAGEIIFVFASAVKFLWFCFFAGNYDLNDLGFFYPLSLINLFTRPEVSRMWIYPLQIVNLFQILYIISLSYGLKHFAGINTNGSDKVVLCSYVPALVIWTSLIMFISLDVPQ